MSKIDKLEVFSLEYLKLCLSLVESFESKDEMHNALIAEIKSREEAAKSKLSLNDRFDIALMKKLNIFYPDELNVLIINNIKNLQELIDCDLYSLVGITESIKEKLNWARYFYDMRTTEEKQSDKAKQKRKK